MSELEVPQPQHPKVKPMVYVVACISAISGLVFGYDIGGSGGSFVMDPFRTHFGWPTVAEENMNKRNPTAEMNARLDAVADQQGWITGMFAIGCIIGSLPSGYMTDRFGRKNTILGLTAIFTVGAVMQLCPTDLGMLYAGRFISGLGVGGLSMAATLYQSETAPSHIRGLIVSLQQLAITLGILLAGGLNVGLQYWEHGWRISYGGKAFFSLILFVSMLFMPESPRWLVAQGRIEDAIESLRVIRYPEELEIEAEQIRRAVEEEQQTEESEMGSWKDLIGNKEIMWYRTMLGFFIQLFQQFSGINAVMYFAPVIFGKFLSTEGAIAANMAVGLVNFMSTFIALYLVDRAGRRILLVSGGFGMGIFTGVFAILTSSMFEYEGNKVIGTALILVTALYVMNFSYSWGPLAWVVAAEVFPQNLRGRGMTLTTMANWITNLLIAKMVPIMMLPTNLDLFGTFAFFSACCGFMGFFTLMFLPETKGCNLEQMEDIFRGFMALPFYRKLQMQVRVGDEEEVEFVKGRKGDIEMPGNGEGVDDESKEQRERRLSGQTAMERQQAMMKKAGVRV